MTILAFKWINLSLQALGFWVMNIPAALSLCVSESMFFWCFWRTFTSDSEVLWPQTAHDVVQEEALLGQRVANETSTLQGVIQHATQNCTHFLSLACWWCVDLCHNVTGCYTALVTTAIRKRKDKEDNKRESFTHRLNLEMKLSVHYVPSSAQFANWVDFLLL